jgi:hypothetical protein
MPGHVDQQPGVARARLDMGGTKQAEQDIPGYLSAGVSASAAHGRPRLARAAWFGARRHQGVRRDG